MAGLPDHPSAYVCPWLKAHIQHAREKDIPCTSTTIRPRSHHGKSPHELCAPTHFEEKKDRGTTKVRLSFRLDLKMLQQTRAAVVLSRAFRAQATDQTISLTGSRYIYDLYYEKEAISKQLYDWLLKNNYADAMLIAKWKKQGYEKVSTCCTQIKILKA